MLDEREQPEIRALFAQVFGAPMSEALWRWKYAEGRGAAAGVREMGATGAADPAQPRAAGDGAAGATGALLAHYGGTRRDLCLGKDRIAGVQMGDVMVRPDARGILSRSGPFATVTRHFIAERVGEAPRFALGFGFPSGRHTRLGEVLGLYRALGEVRELRWPTAPARGWAGWRWPLVALATGQAWEGITPHWRAMRAALPDWVLPHRDAAWCRHRYADHPHHRYLVLELRDRLLRRKLGVLVLRPHEAPAGAPAGSGSWEWIDWIGDPRHLPRALIAARAAAADAGAGTLHGWFSAPLIAAFLGGSAPTQTVVCAWCVTVQRASHVPAAVDIAPWWLTSGDTDFR